MLKTTDPSFPVFEFERRTSILLFSKFAVISSILPAQVGPHTINLPPNHFRIAGRPERVVQARRLRPTLSNLASLAEHFKALRRIRFPSSIILAKDVGQNTVFFIVPRNANRLSRSNSAEFGDPEADTTRVVVSALQDRIALLSVPLIFKAT
ncbi:hypothetical protein [Paenibacillus macquariensis]|uniref:hypothetical protein n=1 Tax=Paenibacillus macquariensis TaxID=948756 RepID=UPI001471A2C2|nr:hypothetical protein [Paenibacillus macquariensis]